MKKVDTVSDEILPEYHREDFGPMVRGKYAACMKESSNIIVLDHDLTEDVPNAEAVNQALRGLQEIGERMKEPAFSYDEASDTLYVTFEPGEKATGIELNDHILLRMDKRERKAVGLSIFNYSILAQTTEIGYRSFPLTGLMELSAELQEIVLDILQRPPVSNILTVFAYTPSYCVEPTPITALQPIPIPAG